jgi:lipoyl(octanoyl) transferase
MIDIHPLKSLSYEDSHNLQKKLVNELKSDSNTAVDQLILCEHPPTYTFGKSADLANLLVNEDFLKSIGAKSFKIERGGDITYHGPGQLVGYPILNLKNLDIGVRQYVYLLEQSIINTLLEYGIACYRIDGQIGLWVNQEIGAPKKIAAIGIKVSQGITMHGFALNVNTDLTYFDHIVPCGIPDKGVTSMQLELDEDVDMAKVVDTYSSEFCRCFGIDRK